MTDPYFVIRSEGGVVYSNEIQSDGIGVEIQSRLTGLGLPPVAAQFDEGLGDGSTYRGSRVQSRSLDFEAHCWAPDRGQLRSIVDRFSMVLAHPCTVTFVDPDLNEAWTVSAARTGGGDYNYGADGDAGSTYVNISWTMQSEDPYWQADVRTFEADETTHEVFVTNDGTVPSPPVWTITGPTNGFTISHDDVVLLNYSAYIPAGSTITVNAETGTVYDESGANRYEDLVVGDLSNLRIPVGAATYVFGFNQDFTDTAPSRTNHIINGGLWNDPENSSYGDWNVTATSHEGPTNNGWDSASGGTFRYWGFREGGEFGASSGKAEIWFNYTGLTVGQTYEFRTDWYQAVRNLISGSDTPQAGRIRIYGSDGSFSYSIANVTLPWQSGGASGLQYEFTAPVVTFTATHADGQIFLDPPGIRRSAGSWYDYVGPVPHRPEQYGRLRLLCLSEPGPSFQGDYPADGNKTYSFAGASYSTKSIETTTFATEPEPGLACEVEFHPRRWLVI